MLIAIEVLNARGTVTSRQEFTNRLEALAWGLKTAKRLKKLKYRKSLRLIETEKVEVRVPGYPWLVKYRTDRKVTILHQVR